MWRRVNPIGDSTGLAESRLNRMPHRESRAPCSLNNREQPEIYSKLVDFVAQKINLRLKILLVEPDIGPGDLL